MEENVNQTAIISVDGKLARIGEAVELKIFIHLKVAGSWWFCDEIYLYVSGVRRDRGLLMKANEAINLLWIKHMQSFLVRAKNFEKLKFDLKIFKSSDFFLLMKK